MNNFFRLSLLIILYSLFIKKVSFRYSFQRLSEPPAAGYRNRETGALGGIGTEGNYRSSSTAASGSVSAGNLNFTASNVNPLNTWYRANAYSVRCVQHLHGAAPDRRCGCGFRILR